MKSIINGLWTTLLIVSLLCCSKKDDPTPDKEEEKEEIPPIVNPSNLYDGTYSAPLGKAGFAAMQQDGKVVMAGTINSTTTLIFRLDKDGKWDPSFNIDQDKSWIIQSIQGLGVQPSGKVIVSGKFVIDNKTYDLIRLTDTGLLDKSFEFHRYVDNSSLTDISLFIKLVQPDGKIICQAYALYKSQSMSMYGTYRINADGTSDHGFMSSAAFDRRISFINSAQFISLPDNKIMMSGHFSIGEGEHKRRNIARLNADGSLDLSFNFKEVPYRDNVSIAGASSLAVQSDGKVIFGGSFNQLVDESQRDTKYPLLNFCRLEKDGTIDRSFVVNNKAFFASKILVRSDDSYITWIYAGSTSPAQIAIFGSNGALKTTYTIADAKSSFSAIFKQSENQYLIAGNIINNGRSYAMARITIK